MKVIKKKNYFNNGVKVTNLDAIYLNHKDEFVRVIIDPYEPNTTRGIYLSLVEAFKLIKEWEQEGK